MKLLDSVKYILLIGVVVSMPLTSLSAQASGGIAFEEYAIHPYASKTGYTNGRGGCTQDFCPNGQTIVDMGITDDGQLVAGYGDWNTNVDSNGNAPGGGVYVLPLNLVNGSWDMDNAVRPGSEALDVIREIGGDVYMTQTDPSNIAPTGYPQGTFGFVTSKGGWQFKPLTMADGSKPNLEHMYDITSLDHGKDDLWAFGSNCLVWGCTSNQAIAMHSTDGGATWSFSKVDNSAPEYTNGYERAYWGQAFDDKVYFQASDVYPATPFHIYDRANDEWSDWGVGTDRVCNTNRGKMVVTFDGELVCSNSSGHLIHFDGVETRTVSFGVGWVRDFYVARDGYLYILADNTIYRTNSLTAPFEKIGTTIGISGSLASSIAVFDDYIYLGGEYGTIYRSSTTIADATPIAPEIVSLSRPTMSLDGKTYAVSVTGKDFEAGIKVSIGGVEMQSSYISSTNLTVEVDTKKLAEALSDQLTQQAEPHQRMLAPTADSRQTISLDLTVVNPNGQSATMASAFTFEYAAQSSPGPTPSTGPTSTQNLTGSTHNAPIASNASSRQLASTGSDVQSVFAVATGVVLMSAGVVVGRKFNLGD